MTPRRTVVLRFNVRAVDAPEGGGSVGRPSSTAERLPFAPDGASRSASQPFRRVPPHCVVVHHSK